MVLGLGTNAANTDSEFKGFDVTNPVISMAIQAKRVTDRAMSRLWAKIQEDGYSNTVIFAMTADHGQHQFMGTDHAADTLIGELHNTAAKSAYNIYTADIKELAEKSPQEKGLGLSLWARDLGDSNINDHNLVYAGNGGMGQFCIRSNGTSRQEEPNPDDILRVARYLDILNVNGEKDGPLPFSAKFAPKKEEDLFSMKSSDGVFGSPSAIFVRVSIDSNGDYKSGFKDLYRWLKVTYDKDANDNIIVQDDGSASIKNIELLPLDDFLDARETVVKGQQNLIESGGPFEWPAFKERMQELSSIRSGDVIVISDGREGYLLLNKETDSYRGWHGGPTVSESFVPLIFSMPGSAFADANGLISVPQKFADGYNEGKPEPEGGYARNFNLAEILKSIHAEFRK